MFIYKGKKITNPCDTKTTKEIIKGEYSRLSSKLVYRKEMADIIQLINEENLEVEFFLGRELAPKKLDHMELIYRAPFSRTTILKVRNHLWIIDIPEDGSIVTTNDKYFIIRSFNKLW